MKMRVLLCFALLLQIVAWFPTTSRILPPNHDISQHSGTQVSTESVEASNSSNQVSGARNYKGMHQLGSSPPNCEHKCYGCDPCVAIQVPTITGRLGIQFANYEPESWKCKCGPTVYIP